MKKKIASTMLNTVVTSLIRPLPSKATPLFRPDCNCSVIVKYYYIIPLKRGHLSYKVISFHFRRGVIIRRGLLFMYLREPRYDMI